jgi:beta-phosphoglucomutase-like phosphatase (HAD superfamily)
MRFEGMIFDIEGTLIDCIPQNLHSWQETLSSFGLTVQIKTLQCYSGKDGNDMLQLVAPGMDEKHASLRSGGQNFEPCGPSLGFACSSRQSSAEAAS